MRIGAFVARAEICVAADHDLRAFISKAAIMTRALRRLFVGSGRRNGVVRFPIGFRLGLVLFRGFRASRSGGPPVRAGAEDHPFEPAQERILLLQNSDQREHHLEPTLNQLAILWLNLVHLEVLDLFRVHLGNIFPLTKAAKPSPDEPRRQDLCREFALLHAMSPKEHFHRLVAFTSFPYNAH